MNKKTKNNQHAKLINFNPAQNSIILTFVVTKVETPYVPQITTTSTKK